MAKIDDLQSFVLHEAFGELDPALVCDLVVRHVEIGQLEVYHVHRVY